MEAVLRNFKTIPCPQGDSCTKPGCQWQHSWERNPPSVPAVEENRDEDGPRKRRKLSSEPASAPTKPGLASAARSVSPPPLKRKALPPTSTPDAARKLPRPSLHSVSSTPTRPDQSIAPAIATTAPVTPQATPQKLSPRATPQTTPQKPTSQVTPRKPEALNPRHLRLGAPASHDFRYKALKMLHEQFQRLNNELKKDAKDDEERLVLSQQELIWLALDEEQHMATDKPAIYQNVIKNRILTYKRMTPGQWKEERAAALKKSEARSATNSAQKPAAKPSLGPPKVIQTGLTAQQEVKFLAHLKTPIDRLSQWGYVPVPPSDEEIAKAREGEEASFGWEVCDRCSTRFQVFPGRREEDGALASGGRCVHHPGRTYFPERAPGDRDKPTRRYRCCQQAVGDSPGCATAETHVFKTTSPSRLAAVIPFAETPPNPLAPKDRAVCFDCEMGYTVRGMELIRLTATSWPDGGELLDVLVRPVGEILDLNSRYSGVWPEDIVNAEPWSAEGLSSQEETAKAEGKQEESEDKGTEARPRRKKMKIVPSPVAARDLLFSLISPETPLIGHGLENDLNAVRIVHPTLIDTILLYPHRRGMPMRHGLKMLMETQLNKAIQVEVDGNAMGHDSAEDARAAGELVRLKVQERWAAMQSRGWRLVDGEFVPPAAEQGGLSERFLEEGHLPGTAAA